MKKLLLLLLLATLLTPFQTALAAKNNDLIKRESKTGRLLWADSKEEAYFFGVNYIIGFSTPYSQLGDMGEDIYKIIDQDVYHLSRMGINGFRLHVWDSEISDVKGNLKQNEHLRLLDYLIYKLEESGIYVFLTPIYYGGAGSNMKYPDQGFSVNYPKSLAHSIPESVAAHKNYLQQFVSHINPYTGKAYKSDPMIVGFEVCNEPWEKDEESVVKFVNEMKKGIGETGCTKPILYNCTTTRNFAPAILKSNIDGGTFQWYPAGLRISRALEGNFLPHVDSYYIPYASEDYCKNKTKIIYEFDAADVNGSYLYPAMAISYKEAGMQWATMFQYEPTPLAFSNTSYYTHYMNLIYSPQKAISLMVASEAFRNENLKRNRQNENRPFQMDGMELDYSRNLSFLNLDDKYYYTSSVNVAPKNISKLKRVAGYKNSPIVEYCGYGAYFLDKISDDVWRLELMPDAIAIKDPHSNPLEDDIKTVVVEGVNNIKIKLPNLGQNFNVLGINSQNKFVGKAQNSSVDLAPGVYLLSAKEIDSKLKNSKFGSYDMGQYYSDTTDSDKTYLIHTPQTYAVANDSLEIAVKVVSGRKIGNISLINPVSYSLKSSNRAKMNIEMSKCSNYDYKATVPASMVKEGLFSYAFDVEYEDGKHTIFPNGESDRISGYTYFKLGIYSLTVLPQNSDIELFYAGNLDKTNQLTPLKGYKFTVKGENISGGATMVFEPFGDDSKSVVAESKIKTVFENYIGNILSELKVSKREYKSLLVNAKSMQKSAVALDVVLVTKNGESYGATALLTDKKQVVLNLSDFKASPYYLLPRPYPAYQTPWYTSPFNKGELDISEVEKIQFFVANEDNVEKPKFSISSIILTK